MCVVCLDTGWCGSSVVADLCREREGSEYRCQQQGYRRETSGMYAEVMQNLDQVPLAVLGDYNGRDAVVTYRAAEKQLARLTQEQVNVGKLLTYVSEPYRDMETRGIGFDLDYSQKLAQDLHKRLDDLRDTIRLEVGEPDLNLDAPAQLGHANPATTLKIYAHWVPGTRRVSTSVLDRQPASTPEINSPPSRNVAPTL